MRTLIAALGIALLWNAGSALADGSCPYRGNDYLSGSEVCQMGTRYRCDYGAWQRLREPCPLQSILSREGCEYEGEFYAAGRVTCRSDTQRQQRCDGGTWQSIGTPCVAPAGTLPQLAQATTCAYGGAQFLAQSIMCRNGTTFVCQAGAWNSLRTACE
jgi:hypothetical protein